MNLTRRITEEEVIEGTVELATMHEGPIQTDCR